MGGGDGDDSGNFNVLCEIEDTFGSDRKDPGLRFDNYLDLRWPLPEVQRTGKLQEKEYKDETGCIRSLAFPFAQYKAPLSTEALKLPLTKNRMAYLIVFDANSQKSYQEAMKIHQTMQEYWLKKEIRLKPVVLLVGNKIDEQGPDFQMVNESAQVYSEDNSIPYYPVSALQYKGVKHLFRNAIQRVRVNQSLWTLEYRQRTDDAVGAAGCGVQ